MKKARKLITFILATVMVLSMSMTAWADENTPHTITITNSNDEYVYDAYQIFVGDYANGKLSNIEWGDGVNSAALEAALKNAEIDEDNNPETPKTKPFAGCTDANSVAEVLAQYPETDNNVAKAFADVVSENLAIVAGSADSDDYNGEKYTISVIGDGYYFVKNREDSVPQEDSSYTRYMLKVTDDVEVAHKGTYPTATKTIIADDNGIEGDIATDRKSNAMSIGSKLQFELTATIPADAAQYDYYYCIFSDKLSEGLTFVNSSPNLLTVTSSGATEPIYKLFTGTDNSNMTTYAEGNTFQIALRNAKELAGQTVTVTYWAELNENAVVDGANTNTAKLEYSNDPNTDYKNTDNNNDGKPDNEVPLGETPDIETTTYTTQLTINKTNGTNPLPGAAFRITGDANKTVITTGSKIVQDNANGTYYKLLDGTYTETAPTDSTKAKYESTENKYNKINVNTINNNVQQVSAEAFVDNNGKLIFTGLGAGDYTITEIVTPDGYNSIEPINIVITFDANTKTFSYTKEGNTVVSTTPIEVVNHSGSELPSTGGIGTTIFYIAGGVLVLVAVVLLVTKKRMKED